MLTFREALINKLEQTGTPLKQVAEGSGVSYEQLKKLKQVEGRETNVKDALKVAAFFDQSLEDFLLGEVDEATGNAGGSFNKPFEDIASRIRWHRDLLGMTQADYASRAGLKRAQLNNWESGDYQVGLSGARALRSTYGLSLDFIYEGDVSALDMTLRKSWHHDQPKPTTSIMTMEVIGAEWLRCRIGQDRGKPAALAKALGIGADKVSKMLAGTRKPQAEEIPTIIAFFNENSSLK